MKKAWLHLLIMSRLLHPTAVTNQRKAAPFLQSRIAQLPDCCKPSAFPPVPAPVERRFHMPIFLWKFKPPKNMKRQFAILTGPALALLTATSGSPLARISQIRHDVDSSILMHVPSTCKFHAEISFSRMFVMYGHTFVRTCALRVFHAFLVVCDGRCAA